MNFGPGLIHPEPHNISLTATVLMLALDKFIFAEFSERFLVIIMICLPRFCNGNFHPFDTALLNYYTVTFLLTFGTWDASDHKFLSWDVEKTYHIWTNTYLI